MKEAQEKLTEFCEKEGIILMPIIGSAERTDTGKVILSPALNVGYKKPDDTIKPTNQE